MTRNGMICHFLTVGVRATMSSYVVQIPEPWLQSLDNACVGARREGAVPTAVYLCERHCAHRVGKLSADGGRKFNDADRAVHHRHRFGRDQQHYSSAILGGEAGICRRHGFRLRR